MFGSPRWDSAQEHYLIDVNTNTQRPLPIKRQENGTTTFSDSDNLLNVTDGLMHTFVAESTEGKWFSKPPTQEQLMRRVKHTFLSLATADNNAAVLIYMCLTPKQLSLVWKPLTVAVQAPQAPQVPPAPQLPQPPPLYFEESSSDSGDSAEIPESNLPAVALEDDSKQSREEYLLTRLRAAKARVEAEQIRMMYFESTGRMPPDSESDEESD